MAKLLVVKSYTNEVNSTTALIAESFIAEYKVQNPLDTVDTLNTYEIDAQPITDLQLTQMHDGTDLKIKPIAEQFASYDKVVFTAPMWNLSIPASLKCYIDYISYAGVTFKYTQTGPVGLLPNTKVMHITSRGGMYSQEPMANYEMGDRYLRTIMGFLGAGQFDTIALDGTNVLQGEEKEKAIMLAKEEAVLAAKTF